MSEVYCEDQPFSIAWLGAENPLPDFMDVAYVHAPVHWDESLSEEDTRFMRYGRVRGILPYMTQDDYTRERSVQNRPVVVLKNDRVCAEFLPWMGGRLWSLSHRGRALISKNPVVQPCNLALRGAWCSGGVEWNVGVRGHQMLTCEQLFTELIRLADGTCGVRFYEYERIRGIVFRIEAYLPPDSDLLFVQVTLANPAGNSEVPMYWWSNIAVPETPGTRVIAPASEAVISTYAEGAYQMSRCALPQYDGMDVSRPTEIGRSIDVFYDLPKSSYKHIAALSEDHTGLIQLSTDRLRGRKLFVWGMGQGGRHWQEFLSQPGERYLEIQAGLTLTQQDHIPMPAGAVWRWLEAYGPLTADVEGLSYPEAARVVAQAAQTLLPREALQAEASGRARRLALVQGESLFLGAGWGALENLWRGKAGLMPLDEICAFPEASMTAAQSPWRALLMDGRFPEASPARAPVSYLVAPHWLALMESYRGRHWTYWYQLGVMRYHAGDRAGARQALEASLRSTNNAWANRCLAKLDWMDGARESALDAYRAARECLPMQRNLFLEYGRALLDAGYAARFLVEARALPEELASLPRTQYLIACACVATGDFARAESILTRPLVIPDMREGELSLSDTWLRLYMEKEGLTRAQAEARHPLPYALDYRMH